MADVDITAEFKTYQAQRTELIDAERRLRHDYEFRQRLSPTAKRAAAIVARIREDEGKNVWKKAEDEDGDVFPGMCFTLAKERMVRTKLWKIVKRLPKGALLHAHLEAMVDMDWLLDRALEADGMGIRSSMPLVDSKAFETADISFEFDPSIRSTSAESLYTTSYTPGTLLSVQSAADAFTADTGTGPAAFRHWFTTRTTITAEESMKQHEGINLIWAKFQSVFSVIQGIIFYEPIFRLFVYEILRNLHLDGGSWADIRMAFVMTLREADTGTPLPRHEVVRAFGEVVDAFTAANPGFWGARIIWTSVRVFAAEDILASMKECIDAKIRYPAVISGFDLVGQEDSGRTLHSHIPEFLQFKHLCAAAGVEIPLFLHAGETLGDGNDTDNNLYDAILLGAKRIGHGFSMYKHPLLMKLAKEKGVCMECCPISNEILRLTASIMQHPLPALLANGVPVSINNDDPGILGQLETSSLSHDYWQVLQAFDNVGLAGIGDLAETGITWAAFDGVAVSEISGVRKQRLYEWRGRWEEFCEWVVAEFGEEA